MYLHCWLEPYQIFLHSSAVPERRLCQQSIRLLSAGFARLFRKGHLAKCRLPGLYENHHPDHILLIVCPVFFLILTRFPTAVRRAPVRKWLLPPDATSALLPIGFFRAGQDGRYVRCPSLCPRVFSLRRNRRPLLLEYHGLQ